MNLTRKFEEKQWWMKLNTGSRDRIEHREQRWQEIRMMVEPDKETEDVILMIFTMMKDSKCKKFI